MRAPVRRSPAITRWLSLLTLTLVALLPAGCGTTDNGCKQNPLGCLPDHGPVDAAVGEPALPGRDAPAIPGPDGSLPAPDVGAYVHEDVSVQTVYQWMTDGKVMTLLDVREPDEFAAGHLVGALNLPWTSGVLGQSLGQLPTDRPLVVYCKSGNRSNSASSFLTDHGFRPVHDMLGGIGAWQAAGFPVTQ